MNAEPLLDRHTFLARFGSNDPRNRVLLRLHALVCAEERWVRDNAVEWLEDLVGWLFERGHCPDRKPGESELDCRARLLLTTADELPDFSVRLKAAVLKVLVGSSSTLLFTDTGIPTHAGFTRELVSRFSRNVLPQPPVGREVSRLLSRLFGTPERVEWLLSQPESMRRRLVSVLGLDSEVVHRALEPGLREAVLLLATRIATHGVADDLRMRLPELTVASSPFLRLQAQTAALLEGTLPLAKVQASLDDCRAALRHVEESLDQTGISIDLVFLLDLLNALLARLATLLNLEFGLEEQRELALVQLERALLRGTVSDQSFGALWQSSTRLLARRVVERAGTSGESYLTRTRQQQHAMLDAAAGGGAIIAFAAFVKFYIHFAHAPPFFEALLASLNYVAAFVLMQLLHFALATKQPSMTAATLAAAIEARRDEEAPDLEPLVTLVARASRTQLTALVGNVLVVIAFSIMIAVVFEAAVGQPAISTDYANELVAQHHPLGKSTLFSAAMTGVWLWAASLLAGAAENYFVLRELPGAIATNRALRRLVGAPRAARVSRFLTEQAGALGGNLGFGFMLGFMPMLFVLLGLPLDGGHVTFISGQLAFAAVQLGPQSLVRPEFLQALVSIPLVGLVNFGVSFAFAIVVALRARGLGVRQQVTLIRVVARRFLRAPRDFFLAPKDELPSGTFVVPAPPTS